MKNLEDNNCNCIRDSRHNFIKYITIFNIICLVLLLYDKTILENVDLIILFINLFNSFKFYTYIRDLNNTKCSCVITKQKYVNNFLYIWRYILLILNIIPFIIIATKDNTLYIIFNKIFIIYIIYYLYYLLFILFIIYYLLFILKNKI